MKTKPFVICYYKTYLQCLYTVFQNTVSEIKEKREYEQRTQQRISKALTVLSELCLKLLEAGPPVTRQLC